MHYIMGPSQFLKKHSRHAEQHLLGFNAVLSSTVPNGNKYRKSTELHTKALIYYVLIIRFYCYISTRNYTGGGVSSSSALCVTAASALRHVNAGIHLQNLTEEEFLQCVCEGMLYIRD